MFQVCEPAAVALQGICSNLALITVRCMRAFAQVLLPACELFPLVNACHHGPLEEVGAALGNHVWALASLGLGCRTCN